MRSSATTAGGCFCRSPSSLATLPVSSSSRILSAVLLPIPSIFCSSCDGQLAQIGRLRRDRLGGALVSAHAEGLGIALLEHGQLGQLMQHVEDVLFRVGHAPCFTPRRGDPGNSSSITVPTVNPRYRPAQRLVLAFAFATLGCGPTLLAGRLTEPGSIAPMTDATLTVAAGRVFVDEDTAKFGMGDDSVLAVELGITNGDREPYTLSAASISCWLELAPDLPAETRSLTPAGGGEGPFPGGSALDDLKLGSVSIPSGQTRSYWIVFRGYRYPGSDVPRKVTISLPDARGRRVQLVIADPARGQLRWEVTPLAGTMIYGIQNTALAGPALDGIGIIGSDWQHLAGRTDSVGLRPHLPDVRAAGRRTDVADVDVFGCRLQRPRHAAARPGGAPGRIHASSASTPAARRSSSCRYSERSSPANPCRSPRRTAR